MELAEKVIVAGDTASAVRMVVVHYMRNHAYRMPSFVHCPAHAMPAHDTVQSWAVRGVTILPHQEDKLSVWASE